MNIYSVFNPKLDSEKLTIPLMKRSSVIYCFYPTSPLVWCFNECDGVRTHDNLIKSQVLFLLSYTLIKAL